MSNVNPARAGMILVQEVIRVKTRGKPRASGDDPWPTTQHVERVG